MTTSHDQRMDEYLEILGGADHASDIVAWTKQHQFFPSAEDVRRAEERRWQETLNEYGEKARIAAEARAQLQAINNRPCGHSLPLAECAHCRAAYTGEASRMLILPMSSVQEMPLKHDSSTLSHVSAGIRDDVPTAGSGLAKALPWLLLGAFVLIAFLAQ